MKNRGISKSRFYSLLLMCLVAVLPLMSGFTKVLAAEGLTGAVWTTDASGEMVNGNLFRGLKDVYLSGGPHKSGALGLPSGEYYFQVTDPSGKTLLSKDDVAKRSFTVEDGCIVSVPVGGHSWSLVGSGPRIVVQLWPFDSATKSGGEYKVWVTRKSDYRLPSEGVFGFISSLSKTDNFKCGNLRDEVPKYFELCVTSGISNIASIAFYVTYAVETGGVPGLWTTGQLLWNRTEGLFEVFGDETTFAVGTSIYWQFSAVNTVSWTSDVHGPELISEPTVNEEVCPLFLVSGHKYSNQPNELNVPAVDSQVNLSDGVSTVGTLTDSNGYYEFIVFAPGTFNVSTVGFKSGADLWNEFTVESPQDQVFDFYDYDILQMANLQDAEVSSFSVVFTPSNSGDGTYKLSSTNPGSFHLNLETFGAPLSPVLIDIILPMDKQNGVDYDSPNFVPHHAYVGGDPADDVHIYSRVGGVTVADVTNLFTVTLSSDLRKITVSGSMPEGAESILVSVHLDYQISNTWLTLDQVNSFMDFKYPFTVIIYGSIFGVHKIFGVH